MTIPGAALVLLCTTVCGLVASCGGGNSKAPNICTPGNTQACTGPGACAGGQSCLADGTAWSTCDCGAGTGRGGTTGSAGATAGAGGSTAGSAGTVGSAGSGGAGQGGGAGSGSTCPANRRLCGNECVDIAGDPRHCGGCGQACGANQVCASSCQAAADCRQTPCVGLTYCDLSNGQCKPGCATDTQCGANETCDPATRACTCKTGFDRCGGACTATSSDRRDCGGVCAVCPTANATAFACSGTSCAATACASGYHVCAGSCVANSSVATCGTSCSACPVPPNGAATCNGTTCGITCNTGTRSCGGTCAACPTTGATAFECSGTSCVATACAASGYQLCGGACAVCPTENVTSFACSGTSCVATACAIGYHVCSGACVSNLSPASCGTSCTPCPTPTVGVATCDGTICNGLWSPCTGSCPPPYICNYYATNSNTWFGVCLPRCTTTAGCAAPASGSPQVVCTESSISGGNTLCLLLCTGGRACPDGMICDQTYQQCLFRTMR